MFTGVLQIPAGHVAVIIRQGAVAEQSDWNEESSAAVMD